ncbi:ABC transporter ATP-binding protein [Neisseria sp. Ec49-e6-T10]|uniref:ABC transporter ATP-binding protein n=1 Tax=Neisseria sp. Ec49-e6-T10 TaxID=3140744 RepID=UPI003EBDE202
MSEPLLSIEKLNAYFGAKQVLFDVSFDLYPNQKMALVGESGSGKTICAQSIIQLNPDVTLSGAIGFEQQALIGLKEKQLNQLRGKKIGMVFQEPMTALNPVLCIGEQIVEVLRLHQKMSKKEAWQEAVRLLEDTGIQEAQRKVFAYPFELSGGQRQRAMIAMAIAGKPKLLIADEPTTALDMEVQDKIIELLNDLQKKYGMAILYITHDLKLVKRFADKVMVMKEGKIVESGTVFDVFSQPQHEYTKKLLDSTPEPLVYEEKQTVPVLFTANDLGFSVPVKKGLFVKDKHIILQAINLQLFKGQTLGIIGESGSGKTTLARLMMRLLQPFTGEMFLENLHWSALKGKELTHARKHIQMVFQDPFGALSPRMSVLDIITEGVQLHQQLNTQEKIDLATSLLCEVGLPEDSLYRYPHEFSGGQRQRIAIARAIAMKPDILVLDEPTSALDVSLQKQMIHLLLQLQEKYQLTMVMISHDLAVIRALSHRVIVLKEGAVVESGTAAEVFYKPNAGYTQKLLQHFNA